MGSHQPLEDPHWNLKKINFTQTYVKQLHRYFFPIRHQVFVKKEPEYTQLLNWIHKKRKFQSSHNNLILSYELINFYIRSRPACYFPDHWLVHSFTFYDVLRLETLHNFILRSYFHAVHNIHILCRFWFWFDLN